MKSHRHDNSSAARMGVSARSRLVSALVSGLAVAGLVVWSSGWQFAPLAGWDTMALVYGVWTWWEIWPMDARATADHAGREDPSRIWTAVLLIIASVASLAAVGAVIAGASSASGLARVLPVVLAIVSVVCSWALVHTIYALRYAEMYYATTKGGIDFNADNAPAYSDFAYLAATIGMTFQVSDTAFQTRVFRKVALRHALLAYLFGTVIVATTINLVAGLNK